MNTMQNERTNELTPALILSWLAGEQWRLVVFQTHGRIYEALAAQMFNVPFDQMTEDNPEYALRQKAEIAELALCYQGSTGSLIAMGALDMGLTEEELPDIVARWRKANPRICELWYAMESAAVKVISEGGCVGVGPVFLSREIENNTGAECLTILLPSGRKLYYSNPSIGEKEDGNLCISYMGMGLGTNYWERIDTYGGKLVENCVQAIICNHTDYTAVMKSIALSATDDTEESAR